MAITIKIIRKMKKNKMTLLAVVLFAACSQEQTDIIQKEIEGDVTGIIMIADDFVADAQTRTVLTPGADGMQFTWADKDTVGIYPTAEIRCASRSVRVPIAIWHHLMEAAGR